MQYGSHEDAGDVAAPAPWAAGCGAVSQMQPHVFCLQFYIKEIFLSAVGLEVCVWGRRHLNIYSVV